MNWKECLGRVNEVNGRYGDAPPPPAKNARELVKLAESSYGLTIPVEFIVFWDIQNGLGYDGNVFYRTDADLSEEINPLDASTNNAIIATNIIWHEVEGQAQYTFLGDGNTDWFVYDIKSGKYLVLDKPSAEVMETFDTFDEFFSTILTRLIGQT